ncbi:MAG TPA: hypothetical protein VEL28_10270 [Candidatus Binatia bacterium]|nr:hypothetical protein [Candidatus Binatia bacterium]
MPLAPFSVERSHLLADTAGLQRIEVEIGPGNCGFLLEAARRRADTLFVGIEIRPSSPARATRRGTPPPNVRILCTDARWMVVNLLAPQAIDAYHVYFPDPWWKKRHHKRRLFTPEFCAAAHRTLRTGGAIYVATDVTPVFEGICENLLRAGFTQRPWQGRHDDPACSSYERKYRAQSRQIHQAAFQK